MCLTCVIIQSYSGESLGLGNAVESIPYLVSSVVRWVWSVCVALTVVVYTVDVYVLVCHPLMVLAWILDDPSQY